ncbi:MAG TPA: hypothetical protein VIY73_19020 [Polyangiaceae bacterium]
MTSVKWSAPLALAAVPVLAVFGAVVACSGATAPTGGQYDGCLGSQAGTACIACIRSNCASALDNLETGCGDLLACDCPGGNFSADNAASPTCQSKATESSCIAAENSSAASACSACDSACTSVSSSSGGSSGGGSSGSGSSSGITSSSGASSSGSSSGGTSSGGSSSGATSSSGSSSGGTSSGGSSSGSSSCSGFLLPDTSVTSLTLTGVDFGDLNGPDDWKGVGYNLDGLCTTATSTDVCTLSAGAAKVTQVDGTGGIDNSFGENICPIMDTISGGANCSSTISQVYLQVDATGSGTMVVPYGGAEIAYPVTDVRVGYTGSGGVVGGVFPTMGLVAAWQAAAPCITTALCSGSAFQSIAQQLEQSSDIGPDGTNGPGLECSAISFGLKFTASSPLSGLPTPPSCTCPARGRST